MATAVEPKPETLRALPGDDVRQIQWHFANRYDLQMLVQSTRAVARGPVARLVAEGMVGTWSRRPAMLNPSFELVQGAQPDPAEP